MWPECTTVIFQKCGKPYEIALPSAVWLRAGVPNHFTVFKYSASLANRSWELRAATMGLPVSAKLTARS